MARKKSPVTPHTIRQGDRVYQLRCPWNKGTVSNVVKDVSFTVVYDSPRGRREPRERYTYTEDQRFAFVLGEPAQMDESPAPVVVEAFGRETDK